MVRGALVGRTTKNRGGANSGLRRGEVSCGPGRGVSERGNHCGFPVHRAQVKLTVAEAMAEARRRRWNDGAMAGAELRAG
jgi:hypothetical protein